MAQNNNGAICGGLVSQSEFLKNPDAYMMAYVMTDKHFKKYAELTKAGKHKEAQKLYSKYAMSAI